MCVCSMAERRFKNNKMKSEPSEQYKDVSSGDESRVELMAKDKREADSLSPEKTEFLRTLVIALRHEVPPQHQVERRAGTRVLSTQEKEEFKRIVPDMKRGTFTSKEDKKITDNWKEFCKFHDWDSSNPKPFLFHRHHYFFYLPKAEERKKFVQFLADGLPKRSLYSVYHRFRNLYDPHKVSKYSHNEDAYIIKHMEENKYADDSRKFADLAAVLNRTRASVWRRYRLLRKKRMNEDSD